MTARDLECAFLRAAAKGQLRADGMTQREAARQLGVTHEHLNRVLCGHRLSAALCRRLMVFRAERRGR